ncbi:MAG TPA: hypothetical protein VJ944_05165 [Thermoplasmataceae archaeon]|nr:hypothetical protein [Thermoplasmataceae archaeon]
MRSYLRIFRTGSFDFDELYAFMEKVHEYGKMHFLISDGIMLDLPQTFPEGSGLDIRIQRILTSYQLQRILLESDNSPHFIAVVSGVISSWAMESVESFYEIMKIKSYYHRCPISMNIVGKGGVYENYLGKRVLEPPKRRVVEGGLYQWEEQHPQ